MKKKIRLDTHLQALFPQFSRQQIQSFILQGKVKVDHQRATKAGMQILPQAIIETDLQEPRFVSRAGFKLEKALDYWHISVQEAVCLDAGISTGGFTDCLLQRGARLVYGVDVGYGQVHHKIRQDPRLVLLERTNLRTLTSIPEKVDIVTLDLSFISVLKVMEVVAQLLKPAGKLIILIKPQFEARKDQVAKGGIVRDPNVHNEVIEKISREIPMFGFELIGVIDSPLLGTTGNKEFLAYFVKRDT